LNGINREYIKKIIGQPLISIGRVADMLWICMGETIVVKNYKGEEVEKSSLAIHVQSPWRITDVQNESILLAAHDVYEPKSDCKWSEEFEWDISGNNLFDERVEEWNKSLGVVYVMDYELNVYGDLEIFLSNNCIIEIFINKSSKVESWRFFEPYSEKEHLIIPTM
jgi:hypothetical protein